MKKGKILFRGFETVKNRIVGYGDIFSYSHACYFKGKDLGYDEIHIVFPRFIIDKNIWQLENDDSLYWQKTEYLPWKYYPRNKKINEDDWDCVIDTSKENAFFEGSTSIEEILWSSVSKFFEIRLMETGKSPYLDIPRDHKGKPYILFHFRKKIRDKPAMEKNTPIERFEYAFNVIKNHLGDKYEYWKVGEPSAIDNRFDRIVPNMYHDIDGFIKIIRNCSLIVGGSAPLAMAWSFKDVPIIYIDLNWEISSFNPIIWGGYTPLQSNEKSLKNIIKKEINKIILFPYQYTKIGAIIDLLSRTDLMDYILYCGPVKCFPSWCFNKMIIFKKGKMLDKDKIVNFLNKNNI